MVVCSGAPRPNKTLQFLYGALDLLKKREVETSVLFTYFPYSMQDQEFHEGELNSAKSIIEKLEKYYDVGKIYALNPHFSQQKWVKNYSLEILDISSNIMGRMEEDLEIIGTDEGVKVRFGFKSFIKKRINQGSVKHIGEVDTDGKRVAVFDDIIESGGTMISTYDKLSKKKEIKKMLSIAIHGVKKEGCRKVSEKFDKFYLTNSIDNPYSNVRIEPYLERKLDLERQT